MSNKTYVSHNSALINLPILDILEQSGLCYTIKNSKLEYLISNAGFKTLFNIEGDFKNDFDIFLPEIAYDMGHEDNLLFTSQVADENSRVLISTTGVEVIVNVSRSIVQVDNESVLVTILKDITKKSQEEQFDAYKQVLTEPEVFEKMLNRFSNIIFSSNNKREIFEGVGNLCLDLLDLEDLSIFLIEHQYEVLKQTVIVKRGQEIQFEDKNKRFITVPLSRGITGRCARTKETILVDDVSLDPDYIFDSKPCKSELAVPIVYKDKLIGVIDSESSINGRYTDKIKRTLEGIASLLAIKLNELKNYEELSAKNVELKSLIKDNPVAIAMLDNEGNYIEVSKKWISQFVKNNEHEIIGKNHFELNPNIPLRWKRLINQAFAGEAVELVNESYERKNGNVVVYTAKVNPWFTAKNRIGGVVIMADDITEQVQTKMKLLESTEELTKARKYGRLFNWQFDLETGLLKWDNNSALFPGFEADTEYSLDSVFKFIDKEYHADFNRVISEALDKGGSYSFIHPFTINDTKYWLHNRGEAKLVNGKVSKIVGDVQDITNEIDTEKALRSQNIELKKINRELDQFVYKTAHDLRAPLTNLIGLIGIMRNEEDKQVLNSYYDLQEKSIEKLDSFIQKITAYTKNTRLPAKATRLNFSKITDEVLRAHYYYENSEKIAKVLNVDRSAVFYSDEERVKIILNNLISNAIKFSDLSKDNPQIEIAVSQEKELIRIKVRDNGLGIAKELQPKVYDMFYRAHKSADGAGIGLYIVKETINRLNGSIHLSSEEGEYTEVNIFLPNQNKAIK
ncbi:MAG: hypothetical protein COA58_03190 [Bacteroidetes bacterium]|nr:MAG: hypothetical protein COA58_03190 [Bacteroidota bacterium]